MQDSLFTDLKPSRKGQPRPIQSAHIGKNAELIKAFMALYGEKIQKICDLTYGVGAFWTGIDLTGRELVRCDLDQARGKDVVCDCRDTPFRDESFDLVVFDPPYGNLSTAQQGSHGVSETYQLTARSIDDLCKLYFQTLCEAHRILRRKHHALAKCQDAVESNTNHWFFKKVFDAGFEAQLVPIDLMVLIQESVATNNTGKQRHFRKNHSYLWVFEKRKH